MKTSGATEKEIAACLAAKDFARAATIALKGYGPQILHYLRGVLRNDDLSDDVFADFCERLWSSIQDYRGDALFGTWAYRIAWCALKDLERTRARRREDRLATEEVSRIIQEIRTSTKRMIRTEVRDRWARIKDSLTPAERSLLLLRVEKNLPWKEVAEIMAEQGEPAAEAALRQRLVRLHEKLRVLAKEHGLR